MEKEIELEFQNDEKRHGKQANQKLKPLLVWNYLCRNTDENHFATANEIVDHLKNYLYFKTSIHLL